MSNKRSRSEPEEDNSLTINDLPDGIFADVAAYLAKPSKALFAVAMTAPSTTWTINNNHNCCSGAAAAIMTSNSWEALDFGDIEKYLAAKLSDDDVGAILLCIKAKTTLKTLKLTGCVNIKVVDLNR